jgi:multimeric flavodoxin WrbA
LDVLGSHGIKTELVHLAGKELRGCTDCGVCIEDEVCSIEDDLWPIFEAMKRSDAIIVSVPTYFGSATPESMALLDRAGYIARKHGNPFARKVGSPIAVSRRAGHNFTFAQLLMWFNICGFVVPGSSYWSVGIGRHPGEVLEDEEGLQTIRDLGENIAWLLKLTRSQEND